MFVVLKARRLLRNSCMLNCFHSPVFFSLHASRKGMVFHTFREMYQFTVWSRRVVAVLRDSLPVCCVCCIASEMLLFACSPQRLAMFAGFTVLEGISIGPLVQYALWFDRSIVITAALGTATIFACFSLAALLCAYCADTTMHCLHVIM